MDMRFCRARILALRSICGCRPLERLLVSDFQMASAVGLPNRGCWSVLLAIAAILTTRAGLKTDRYNTRKAEHVRRVHNHEMPL